MIDNPHPNNLNHPPFRKTSLFVGLLLVLSVLMAGLPVASAAAPVASFTVEPAAPSTADLMYFNSTSTDDWNNITSYSWDMGDGTSLTGASVTHQYADNGTYTVILNVTDNETFYDTHTEIVTVSNVGPSADFSFAPGTPSTADTVTFTDASTDSDGTIASWSWDLGDGNTSTSQNPTHTYADDGAYIVILTATDDDGASDSFQATVNVANVAPTANFSASATTGTTATTFSFTDSSTDPDGTIANWTWDFGDGSAFNYTQNPTHQYGSAGTYVVNLTATDDDGGSSLANVTITVSAPSGGGGGGSSPSLTPPGSNNVIVEAKITYHGDWVAELYVYDSTEVISVQIPDENARVSQLEVQVSGEGGLKIILTELEPEETPAQGHFNLLDTFDLHVEAYHELEYELAILELRVPDDLPQGVEPRQLMALHGEGGHWEAIPSASYTGDDGTIRFQALTYGFSPFALAVDEEEPQIQTTEPDGPVAPDTHIAFVASDNRAVRGVTLTVDGAIVQPVNHEDGYLYKPEGGFAPGEHTVHVEVEDLSGLKTVREWSFSVAGAPDTPQNDREPASEEDAQPRSSAESPALPLVLLVGAFVALAGYLRRRD